MSSGIERQCPRVPLGNHHRTRHKAFCLQLGHHLPSAVLVCLTNAPSGYGRRTSEYGVICLFQNSHPSSVPIFATFIRICLNGGGPSAHRHSPYFRTSSQIFRLDLHEPPSERWVFFHIRKCSTALGFACSDAVGASLLTKQKRVSIIEAMKTSIVG